MLPGELVIMQKEFLGKSTAKMNPSALFISFTLHSSVRGEAVQPAVPVQQSWRGGRPSPAQQCYPVANAVCFRLAAA